MGVEEHRLHRIFYPRSVAVVGAKRANNYNLLRNLLRFSGPRYNVNIDRDEWPGAAELGVTSYASLLDIPDPVDYVSITVPAAVVPRVLEDCIKKGVIGVQVFTSGFGESGTEEGTRLEETIIRMARGAGLLVVGPNCLGIFNPDTGFGRNRTDWEPGHVGFISQSGNHTGAFMAEAEYNGVPVSKAISMGNGIIVDTTDYMDYLLHDPQTRVIGLFLEGIRDGRRFFTTLREVCRQKPVVVWKVGETEDAARATASHTGSVAGSQRVYESLLRQCGALQAASGQEMIDMAKAYLHLPPLPGLNLGLFSISGGPATQMTNVFSKAGFRVPLLPEASQAQIRARFDTVAANYRNPIEVSEFNRLEDFVATVLDGLNDAENIDCIVHEWSVPTGPPEGPDDALREARLDTISGFAARARKPYVVVTTQVFPQPPSEVIQSVSNRLIKSGVPSFPGFERAARALRNVVQYQRFRREVDGVGTPVRR